MKALKFNWKLILKLIDCDPASCKTVFLDHCEGEKSNL